MPDRMFLAVALDDECRHAVAAHLDDADRRLPGRAVPPGNWHITLRFLGPTTATQADMVLRHLDEHLGLDPFQLRFAGLGGFPSERKASVLWLGIGGAVDQLGAMAEECESAAVSAGFEPEGRPFHPHLTLSRIRPPVDVRALVDDVSPAEIKLRVASVVLYRSVLGNGPARYEVVERVKL